MDKRYLICLTLKRPSVINLCILAFILSFLSGCATVGSSVVKTYNDSVERNQIAILRVDQKSRLRVFGCDGIAVPHSARYILLQPGRHEVLFSISGQTFFEVYRMTNKKYLDAVAGHTYILKSKGGGIFTVGNKWFPEVVDVSDDIKLHVQTLPQEAENK